MIDIPDSIFPSNDQGQSICPQCKKTINDCQCKSFDPSKPKINQFKPHLRLDKKGRKGKAVVVIDGLLADELYLKELAKKIKSKTGSGGTFYINENVGVIEIQGEKKGLILDVLRREGVSIEKQ